MILMTWPQYLRGECSVDDTRVHLTGHEATVLLALLLRSYKFTSTKLLIDILYGDRIDGGAERAEGVVYAVIMKLRSKLPDHIETAPWWGYRLVQFTGANYDRRS